MPEQVFLDRFATTAPLTTPATRVQIAEQLRTSLQFCAVDCMAAMPAVLAWLLEAIKAATAADFATEAVCAALRLYTDVLVTAVVHRTSPSDLAAQAPTTQACLALVKPLVAILALAKTPHSFKTLDVFHAVVSCTKVLSHLALSPACWPSLLEAQALRAVIAAAAVIEEVLKPAMFQRNQLHVDMLYCGINMVTHMAKAPGELDLFLYEASKQLLAAVRNHHWNVQDLVFHMFDICCSLFARVIQLDHVVNRELDTESNFMAYFEELASFFVIVGVRSRVTVSAAHAFVRMMKDAAVCKHAVEVLQLMVFAISDEGVTRFSLPSATTDDALAVLLDGFADVLPVVQQFDAFTTRRFSCILQWYLRADTDARFDPSKRLARFLARFVPTMADLMRKHSADFRVAAGCCDVLYPLCHKYGFYVDFKLLAPAAPAITDLIVAAGCNLVGTHVGLDNFDSFVWGCVRVLESLALLEQAQQLEHPSVTLQAVQPLSKLAVELLRVNRHQVECILDFFSVLSKRRDCHDALRSSSQGYLEGFTRLLDAVLTVSDGGFHSYGRVLTTSLTCLWALYEPAEFFSAEDVACLAAVGRVLQRFGFMHARAAFLAKVELAQTQHTRWTDLRSSWVGAVGQHQAVLHEEDLHQKTMRKAAAALEAALAGEDSEDEDWEDGEDFEDEGDDADLAPARKLVRHA